MYTYRSAKTLLVIYSLTFLVLLGALLEALLNIFPLFLDNNVQKKTIEYLTFILFVLTEINFCYKMISNFLGPAQKK